jgi:hypothetical protein
MTKRKEANNDITHKTNVRARGNYLKLRANSGATTGDEAATESIVSSG